MRRDLQTTGSPGLSCLHGSDRGPVRNVGRGTVRNVRGRNGGLRLRPPL